MRSLIRESQKVVFKNAMKLTQVAILIVFALPVTLSAESYSRVETSIFTSSGESSSVESRVQTSGDAEVRIYTVINGEVIEDIHLQGEGVVRSVDSEDIETNPLSNLPIIPKAPESSSSMVESRVEVLENQTSDSFIEYLRKRDFFLRSSEIEFSPTETNNEKMTWSASFISALNQFFTHFF
jgi:hypothetical protein